MLINFLGQFMKISYLNSSTKKVSVELPRSAVLWTFHNIQMQVPTELLRSSSSTDTFPGQPKSVGRTAKVRSFTVITFSPAGKMSVELPRSSSSVGPKNVSIEVPRSRVKFTERDTLSLANENFRSYDQL